jgi:HAE1 family hydrophobic/amphiphilic exporter-1
MRLISIPTGKRSAIIALYQLPGSNAVQVAKAVRASMAQLSARFPQDIAYTVSLDTTLAVTAGIHEIVKTLFEALSLVVLVVYIFLQGWRATLIPLLAVPVALIGTFALFPLLGFSINTLSLLGLVLAIGLVVDDAIVVVEAVEHHIEEGLSPRRLFQGNGAGCESRDRDCSYFGCCIYSDSIYSGHYRTAVSTVCRHHRHLCLFSAFNALTLSPALCC